MSAYNSLQQITGRSSHLGFMKYCWDNPDEKLLVGFHTMKICETIDKAIAKFKKGESSFIRIAIHPRSGKSDLVSRFLPAHFIGMFPNKEVFLSTHTSGLCTDFGRCGRELIKTRKYKELYPNISLSKNSTAADHWEILDGDNKTKGLVQAASLGASFSGIGFHLGILDDYIGKPEQADSTVFKEKIWKAFTANFYTRRNPRAAIIIVLATQWATDDIHGRIEDKNNEKHEEYDPNFPVFEVLKFPAKAEDYKGEGKYPGKYLFDKVRSYDPEKKSFVIEDGRFSEEVYKGFYAVLSNRELAAMYDCDPISARLSILDTEHIQYHMNINEFPKVLKKYRIYDYAHSAKQRTGDDPDFTGGTLLAFQKEGWNKELKQYRWSLWIYHYFQFQEKAVERDRRIREQAGYDGERVVILVEDSLDAKDGANYLQYQLGGIRKVIKVRCKGDKVARCTPLEPMFESGNVHVLKSSWNKEWVRGLEKFDGTGRTHDEMVDNITCGYEHICKGGGYSTIRSTW